jgi:CCDC81-like prokaryotic HU domain 1/CCDC81-like prokaryotic HU domain 2
VQENGSLFDINQENRLSMYQEMGKHIAQLLYRHDCVVIPNFGAFLTHYQSATIDLATGAIAPPTKTLSFNTALDHNDGLLANAIVQHDSVAYSDALTTIQQFVKAWNHDLTLQGILSIQKVGRFISDAQGRVQFLPEALNYNDDAYLLPQLQFTPILQERISLESEQTTLTELPRNRIDTRVSAPIRPLPALRNKIKRWENGIVAAALLCTGMVLLYLISPSPKKTELAKVKTEKRAKIEVSQASVLPLPSIAPIPTTPALLEVEKPAPVVEVVKTPVKAIKKIKIAKATVKPVVIKATPVPTPETPVERFNVTLGAYKSPANVEALRQRASANNDIITTEVNAKGLTVVRMTVQIRRSELNTKLGELQRIYGTRPVVK